MSLSSHPTKKPPFAETRRLARQCTCYVVLAVCVYAGFQTTFEWFHIPTGSMAPALYGNHRCCACPRCGIPLAVGKGIADVEEKPEPRSYRKAFCQNCGQMPLPMTDAPGMTGEKILVNKAAYWVRAPARWEMVVFRLLGAFLVKRILGLPGEEILIHDGDLYVNGQLSRKTLAEARALRVPVFDQEFAPASKGWVDRWELNLPSPSGRAVGGEGVVPAQKKHLSLDALLSPQTLTYRNFSLDLGKCEPIRDEYAYNAGVHADSSGVHDFLLETDLEATAGRGAVALRLCDGHDWVEVLLPVGAGRKIEAFAWPTDRPEQTRQLAESQTHAPLQVGRRYRVELAFVDRRICLAIDGKEWLCVDLPEAKRRSPVERPFQVHADGVRAELHRLRLFRDIHYGQQGNNAVNGKSVRLGANQYFMMGDNSANSEDSRFWIDDGRVDDATFLGPVLFTLRNR